MGRGAHNDNMLGGLSNTLGQASTAWPRGQAGADYFYVFGTASRPEHNPACAIALRHPH